MNKLLEALDKKLTGLTEEEKKERNIYLKKLAEGTYYGPETGYLHIDKPWLKEHSEDFLREDLPKKTVYGYLYERTKNYKNLTALSYFKKKVSFQQLNFKIKEAAKILHHIGAEDESRALYLLPNIPETTYFFYASAMTGVISDYMDPRPDSLDLNVSAKKLLEAIKEEKITHIACLDSIYLAMIKPIEKELKELGIDNIVTINPDLSMNKRAKLNYVIQSIAFDGVRKTIGKLKQTKKINKAFKKAKEESILNVYTYDEIKELSKNDEIKEVEYQKDKICSIVHTSGTSGKPKPIALTHDNINGYAHQKKDMDMNFKAGDTAMHILPFFAAYGIVNLLHVGLCEGVCMYEIPEIASENFVKVMNWYKANICVGIPTWFNAMMQKKCKRLNHIKWISYGGMPLSTEEENAFNEFLKDHGCPVKVSKGFGLSETGGNCSLETGEDNKLGYSGIPTPLTTFAVVDPKTKEILRFTGESETLEGELLIAGPTVSTVPLDETNYLKLKKMFGEYYAQTGDIVSLNKEGDVLYKEREDRVFQRYDGYNVKPWSIEEVFEKHPLVKKCIISPYIDPEKLGNMVKANIILEENLTVNQQVELIKELLEQAFMSETTLATRQIPTKFLFRDFFPLNRSEKVDFKRIYQEELTGNEITVEIDETNVSINDIRVVAPKKSKVLSLYDKRTSRKAKGKNKRSFGNPR